MVVYRYMKVLLHHVKDVHLQQKYVETAMKLFILHNVKILDGIVFNLFFYIPANYEKAWNKNGW